LATATPSFGSPRSIADSKSDLATEDAAAAVDVGDRLLDAFLELQAERGAAAADRPATPMRI